MPLSGCTSIGGDERDNGCDYEINDSCFPMRGGEFARMISESNHLDGYSLAAQNNGFFRIEAEQTSTIDGVKVVNSWALEKFDDLGMRYVSHTLMIGGNLVAGYQIYDGLSEIYISDSDMLSMKRGRDMSPEYEDPFIEIQRLSQQEPGGVWPPFYYDFNQFEGQTWTVTGDYSELFQVGSTSKLIDGEVIQTYVATSGFPPEIVAIEVFKENTDILYRLALYEESDIPYYELLRNGTLEGMWFEAGLLTSPTFDRAAVPFIPLPQFQLNQEGITEVSGLVPEAMIYEVNLSEIEMHVFIDNSSVAQLMLENETSNSTSDDGTWWELVWQDYGIEGLLSSHDSFSVRTNSSETFDIRIFDLWANAWTDGGDQ
ncbi:MAG: hypothetical protein CMA12_01895 [Euryarchaeota archaeon]|nr:hypothetical protein [Euryarchaeota archaeon]OUW22986.1 MAG: hypothetical protein CBD33_00470 [Euryarchaeota archaeon TMED173]